jgi:prepilin-type N-terminal cleavage/methylation domain-containing protein
MHTLRKAFTLIELLVVIAIIAILAAILFPVFAQAKESAKAAADLSNIKQMGLANLMYATDYDDMMPLGHGVDGGGVHGWNFSKYTPADWPATPDTPLRVEYSRTFILNTVQPYVKNGQINEAPGMNLWKPTSHDRAAAPGRAPFHTSYAYNGLLHGYNHTAIQAVAMLPMFTEHNGNRNLYGGGFANPALRCPLPNVPCYYRPPASNCASDPFNGSRSVSFTRYDNANSSQWMYKRGANWTLADGHAKFRRLGMQVSPDHTNPREDPKTLYNTLGQSGTYWCEGPYCCHAYLFRPDFTFPW